MEIFEEKSYWTSKCIILIKTTKIFFNQPKPSKTTKKKFCSSQQYRPFSMSFISYLFLTLTALVYHSLCYIEVEIVKYFSIFCWDSELV